MKLPIKKKYFDQVKSGIKDYEIRDAHITFICEETGEIIKRDIDTACVVHRSAFSHKFNDVLGDEWTLFMKLKNREELHG